jgi:hypothetical protein
MAGFAPVQEYVPQPAPVPDDVGMNSTLPLAFTAFLASGLLAQDPQSRSFAGDATVEATDLRIPVHTHAEDPSYGTWAAGGSYKACFDGGMTFYPELGPDYPHNQPLAWRTASVRVGDQELLTGGRAPAMSHSEFRVEYAHGAVTEAYDVRTEGLEQTFVFAQRPAANGDLCITGALRSVLVAPRTAPAVTDLVFSDENGMPILRYGRAVAIDVHGDSFPMTTSYLDGRITLRLAAADLARAEFPLVVDPLLAVSYTSQLGNAVALGDLDAKSYGSGSITATVCYTRHFSALDSDITVCTGTALLSSLVPRFSDLSSAASADHARSTYVAATNRWVVVYQNLIAATQVMQLRVAMFDAGTTSGSITTYAHLVASGTHEWRPEVGGVTGGGLRNPCGWMPIRAPVRCGSPRSRSRPRPDLLETARGNARSLLCASAPLSGKPHLRVSPAAEAPPSSSLFPMDSPARQPALSRTWQRRSSGKGSRVRRSVWACKTATSTPASSV